MAAQVEAEVVEVVEAGAEVEAPQAVEAVAVAGYRQPL